MKHHYDSIAEIQRKRETNPELRDQRFYGADVAAYSYEEKNMILQLYNLNTLATHAISTIDPETILHDAPITIELRDLRDDSRRINLSNPTLRKHLLEPADKRFYHIYPRLGFDLADVVKGKTSFQEIYGAEATKLFAALHGEDTFTAAAARARFGGTQGTCKIFLPIDHWIYGPFLGEEPSDMKKLYGTKVEKVSERSTTWLFQDRLWRNYDFSRTELPTPRRSWGTILKDAILGWSEQ
jgi:hypothetical protein